MNLRLSGRKLAIEVVIAVAVGVASFLVYQQYGQYITETLFSSENIVTVYVGSTAVSVTVADSESERLKGLSGVKELGEFEGKLFIFDDEQKYGIWMKDMNFPIDIMWFNNEMQMVYMVENVSPDTYPQVFAPPKEARFVLETNAHFIRSLNIQENDILLLPVLIIPKDLKQDL